MQCNRNARDNRAGHLFPVGMTPNTFSLFSFQKCQFYFTLNVIVVFDKYLFWTTQFIRLQPVVTRSNHKWSISIYIYSKMVHKCDWNTSIQIPQN